MVFIEQIERRACWNTIVLCDLDHQSLVPCRRHRLAPRKHSALLDGQRAVHHEVFAEATLHANALAAGARTKRRVERKDPWGEFWHEGAVFRAREVLRPCDGFAGSR